MPKQHPPAGLLTATEREQLTAPETDPATREEIQERVRGRLHETLIDCLVVYPTLRDGDIDAVFSPGIEDERCSVRAATQSALGLLVSGMLATDDLLEMRLADAIQHAAVAHGEIVSLDLEIRRSPLPPFEARLARFDEEGLTDETLPLYEELLWTGTHEQVVTAGRHLGITVSDEEFEAIRECRRVYERMPQTAVTAIETTEQTNGE